MSSRVTNLHVTQPTMQQLINVCIATDLSTQRSNVGKVVNLDKLT